MRYRCARRSDVAVRSAPVRCLQCCCLRCHPARTTGESRRRRAGAIAQLCPTQVHQHPLEAAAGAAADILGRGRGCPALPHRVLQQNLSGLDHRFADLAGEVELELFEAGLDFAQGCGSSDRCQRCDVQSPRRSQSCRHFIAGPDTAVEQLEFLQRHSSSYTRASASLLRSTKLTTTTSCFCP